MSFVYCSSFRWQMAWCCGVDHICVLLVSVALGSITQPPQQDPTPTAGPNPHSIHLHHLLFLQFNLYVFYVSLVNCSLQKGHKEKAYILHNMS